METSDSLQETETRVVMTAEFNEKNCAECPASEGEAEKCDDDTVACKCELQQAIAEGRFIDASALRWRIGMAFGHTEGLPKCNALKNLGTLEKEVQRRITAKNMFERMRVEIEGARNVTPA